MPRTLPTVSRQPATTVWTRKRLIELATTGVRRLPRKPWERVRQGLAVDLTQVRIPIMAINGEFDRPLQKTHRMWRELRNFTNVVLSGKSHLTAIMADYLPPEYSRHLTRFIDANDVTR